MSIGIIAVHIVGLISFNQSGFLPFLEQNPQSLPQDTGFGCFSASSVFFLSVHCQVLDASLLLVIPVQHKIYHFKCMVNWH